jgi:hypothetical protein
MWFIKDLIDGVVTLTARGNENDTGNEKKNKEALGAK